jgi:CheY-like chemotaxis protein/HPt (histidine-containing phosphotransfer) domain-containing protein
MTDRPNDWLTDLGHEIRAPAEGMIGMIRLLLETQLGSDQRQIAESVRESAERLLVLAGSMLGTDGAGQDRETSGDDAFDLAALVEDAAAPAASRAALKGVEVAVYIHPAAILRLSGDAGRLRRMLADLVALSVDSTARGPVEIDVRAHPLDAHTVKLRVGVAAAGIGAATPDRTGPGERSPGPGLGLAICRRLAEAMGGELGVASEPGRGAAYWIAVPLRLAEGDDGLDALAIAALAGRRAIVLDAHAASRRVLCARLRALGVEAFEADDAADAANALTGGGSVDLLFAADEALAGSARATLGKALRATIPARPRIVLCTRFAGRSPAPIDAAVGAPDAVLAKPVRVAALNRALLELFGGAPPAVPASVSASTPAAPGAPARRPQAAAPAHVLVADDNRVNLRLMAAILEREGFVVDLAEDGTAAVEMVARRDYAAILMDVKMPRMNGLEATARIRNAEAEGTRIPIVALTANAGPGARELYLAAGMDEHVAKPVNRTELLATLQRLVPRAATTATLPMEVPERPAPPVAHAQDVDLDERHLAALRAVLRRTEFENLVAASAQVAETRSAGMLSNAAAGDLAALARGARELAAIAGDIGARRMCDLAASLEAACRRRGTEEAEALARDLVEIVAQTAAELRLRYLRDAV